MIDPEKLLNPDAIKSNLMLSALYLMAYELLKDAVIDNIRAFFAFEHEDDRAIPDKRYDDEVIRTHKDHLHASCLWLYRNGVITDREVEEIESIRRHRNQVAHELPKLLGDTTLNLNVGYFLRIRELLEKIEVWWVQNVDIPANQDFDGEEVDATDIRPGRVMILDYVISAALADHLVHEDRV